MSEAKPSEKVSSRAGHTGKSTASAPARGPRHAPRAPRTPFVLLVLGLIVGGMCALLALNTAAAANELNRDRLAGQDEAVAAQLAQLQNDVAASAAPANLANAAGRLGMVPAGNPAFLIVGADARVRLLGSPAPASGHPTYVAPRRTATKPKPTPTRSSATSTKAATPSKTSSSTKTATSTKTRGAASRTASPTSARRSPPPTPNSTLPGGTR